MEKHLFNRRRTEKSSRKGAKHAQLRPGKRLLLSAILGCLCAFGAGAGPRIEFASTNLDFGKLEAGRVVQHDFAFTNTGDQPLEINDVRPSCDCTMAGKWERRLEPGRFSTIPVRFDSADSYGEVSKTVIVLCNDPAQSNVVLRLSGTVWRPIEITPPLALFAPSSDCQTNETRVVRIVNHGDRPLALSEPECPNAAFRVALRTVHPGEEFELSVTLNMTPDLTNTSVPIVLKTRWPETPTITIAAHAVPKPAVVAVPPQLSFPARPLTAGAALSVTIRNNAATPLALSEPSIDAQGVELRLRELQAGRLFLLEANFPPGFFLDSGQKLQLRVKTNHPQFPLLRVPIMRSQSLAASLDNLKN
jgi:hypothetical protein